MILLFALLACGPKAPGEGPPEPPAEAPTDGGVVAAPAVAACPAVGVVPDEAAKAALIAELDARATRDQEVRQAKPRDDAAMATVDADNLAWLRETIATYGFPSAGVYGPDAVADAWLLLQHGALDLQQACLPVLRERVELGEIKGAHYALLHDRVLVRSGQPQIYGTQFRDADGTQAPCPIDDPAGVDARRAELGMGSLADYAAQMEQMYEQPATTTPLAACPP